MNILAFYLQAAGMSRIDAKAIFICQTLFTAPLAVVIRYVCLLIFWLSDETEWTEVVAATEVISGVGMNGNLRIENEHFKDGPTGIRFVSV